MSRITHFSWGKIWFLEFCPCKWFDILQLWHVFVIIVGHHICHLWFWYLGTIFSSMYLAVIKYLLWNEWFLELAPKDSSNITSDWSMSGEWRGECSRQWPLGWTEALLFQFVAEGIKLLIQDGSMLCQIATFPYGMVWYLVSMKQWKNTNSTKSKGVWTANWSSLTLAAAIQQKTNLFHILKSLNSENLQKQQKLRSWAFWPIPRQWFDIFQC